MALAALHFLYPEWLLLLLLIPVLWWWHWRSKHTQAGWEKLVDQQLMPFVLSGSNTRSQTQTLLWVSLGLALAVLAMAGPAWEKRDVPVFRAQQPLVIGLDFSTSMYAEDSKPNRLTQARFKLLDILNRRADAQNALLVFAGDAFVVTPLSDDRETIQEHVKNLSPAIMPAQGSLLAPAIHRGVELLQQAGMPQGSLLLLTDGVNDVEAAQQAAQASYQQGYRVSILAFGTAEGAPVPRPQGGFLVDSLGNTMVAQTNLAALERIAQAGGGVMLQATQGESDLNTLAPYWQAAASELQQGQGRKADTWINAGYWLLLPLLPLALLAFRRGWLVAVLVCLLLPQPQPVYALSWQGLWQTPDQQAQQAFTDGELARAQELFQNPAWKGAAAYKNGDYATAAQLYAAQEGVTAKYNYANAQARLGNVQEAIQAYQQVLQQDPNHADARYNLELLQQVRQQQNQQQQENSQQNNPQPQQQNQQSEQAQSPENNAAQPEQPQPAQNQAANNQQQEAQQQENKAAQAGDQDVQQREQQQAAEQWLRRIPDDPAELWRRKFLYQYQQRGGGTQAQGEQW